MTYLRENSGMKDDNANKHSEMKDGGIMKLKTPPETKYKENMSASKAVLGAPGSDVMNGRSNSKGNSNSNKTGGY